MPRPTATIPTLTLLCLATLTMGGCGDRGEPIRTYYAPKPAPPDLTMTAGMGGPSAPDMSDGAAATASGNATAQPAALRVHWATPDGWSRADSDNAMRLATISADDTDAGLPPITVARFPGRMGGVTLNVNRWRRQLGLPPVDDAGARDAIQTLSEGPLDGRLVDIASDTKHILVGWFTVGGQQWFFKLSGDTDKVQQARPALMALLRSVHEAHGNAPAPGSAPVPGSPTAPGSDAPASPPMAAGPGATSGGGGGDNPHGFAPLQVTGAFEAGGMTGPVPAGWTLQQNPGGPLLAKLAHNQTDSGIPGAPAQATIAVTRFPGDVGGPLANVNRWRRQVGMDRIDDVAEQDSMAMPIDGRRATIYQVVPTPPKADSQRIIVASIPDGGQTWFVKMTGPSAELEPEVANFVQLISRLDLPGPPPEAPSPTPGSARPEASSPQAPPPPTS